MKGGVYETRYGWQVRFGKLTKRFKRHEKEKAEYFLSGLRFKEYEGTYDIRDYQQAQPLGFTNQAEAFLASKRHLKAVDKYRQRLRFGMKAWGNRNVKEIGFIEFQGLFNELMDSGKSSYYIKHIRDTLIMFWRWMVDAKQIDQLPKFPAVRAYSAMRKILSKADQDRVLAEVYRISWDFNPRIYIGILFLSTYVNIRPAELRGIKERHIELDLCRILIPHPKEGKPKYVMLIPEDVDLIRSLGRSFPEMYFFRHIKGNGNAKPGAQLGKDYLSRWWAMACKNLGIEGVPLYPGTRHTSAVAMRQAHSTEDVKRATAHRSNRAFERYLQITGDEVRRLYASARTDNKLITFPAAVNDSQTPEGTK